MICQLGKPVLLMQLYHAVPCQTDLTQPSLMRAQPPSNGDDSLNNPYFELQHSQMTSDNFQSVLRECTGLE